MTLSRSLYPVALLCALAGMAGCAPPADADPDDATDAVDVQPDLTIGLLEGDSAYLFGAITSIAADTAGRVYVGDRIGATVRTYDADGRYLRLVAREGGGPGEIYGWPADITIGPQGNLYVRDGSRISIFVPRSPGGIADSVADVWPLPGYGNLSSTRSRVSATGTYHYPAYGFATGLPPRYFYLPFDGASSIGDTLQVPQYANLGSRRSASYMVSATSGRMVQGLSHVPFAAQPVWDVTADGTILSASGSDFRLLETNASGDTIRVLTVPGGSPRSIPPAERSDSAVALDARLDTLPVPIDEIIGLGEGVRERALPETLPTVIGLHVGSDGAIWVERWPAEGAGDSRVFDVLDPGGSFRGRIVLRAPLVRDPPPFFGARYVVGVVRAEDTGVERVVRFTLPPW